MSEKIIKGNFGLLHDMLDIILGDGDPQRISAITATLSVYVRAVKYDELDKRLEVMERDHFPQDFVDEKDALEVIPGGKDVPARE